MIIVNCQTTSVDDNRYSLFSANIYPIILPLFHLKCAEICKSALLFSGPIFTVVKGRIAFFKLSKKHWTLQLLDALDYLGKNILNICVSWTYESKG